ncbi:MAG: LysM peptidoglycan-binding domain-containing protein [candidate division KSB1 bacterium]|nr:LysM peptidoglycan-binding domain-containing protein [candidate division KSB1 bacterium]MDZ7273859.1 LysM peptidoglycan-binding domain-containing protein [candidate division KSB1 bacterium]MDZ7286015.1 LysM peptidoglycan-binding domain-containing protein [candidate division KSB1 bacterium]MDZ7299047.1 LysM peptidoglycan-binding domain-containing protein [candidate division KSB1 bacterium]MDZ7308813.1 LysM peptidoglycan-binding domain-containing protein [candidate division KSB1 bacterium]
MALKEKYQDLLDLGIKLQVKDGDVREEGGKLYIKGTTTYQMEKDLLWDKIKTYPNWENEIVADIKVERTDVYGYYTVKSGDTLSKLAKQHLGDAKRYMEIFNLNKDILSNPDLIKVGQKLKLPFK